MKIAVINFSGNVGKSTVARHLLLPRIEGAELFTIESINADEGAGDMFRGKQYGTLQEQLILSEGAAVVDIGASNVEDFTKQMRLYRGSHEDYDLFIVPVVKDSKQVQDSIATIKALRDIGVPPKKIRVVFNRLDGDDTVEDAFYPFMSYHKESRAFTLNPKAVIYFNELFHQLSRQHIEIAELCGDKTDYKARLRETKDPEERRQAVNMISMRRLAGAANENLDEVYSAIMP